MAQKMNNIQPTGSKKTNLAVYTALFGDYDKLIDPPQKYHDCDFICFTDQKHIKSKVWEIRFVEENDLPSNMMNRKYKIFPDIYLPEYLKSLYVDANVKIKKNPVLLAKKFLQDFNIAIPLHFSRNCIYDEANEVVRLGRAPLEEVQQQISLYREQGFPKGYGLTENNIILRNHHSPEIKALMAEWWHMLETHTKRDQLSLMFLVWKHNVNLAKMQHSARGGSYFGLRPHLSRTKTNRWIRIKSCLSMNYPKISSYLSAFKIK